LSNENKLAKSPAPMTIIIVPIKNTEFTIGKVISALIEEVMATSVIRPINTIGPSQPNQLRINGF
jgi:hypothetical protein